MTGAAPSLALIEQIARDTMTRLPAPFPDFLAGVLLIVDDFADEATLAEMEIDNPFELSGLYTGRPVGEPPQTGDPPATIHLYRRAILDEWCDGGETLEHLVAHVLIHEVGHHFGLSDEDMHALEDAV